MTELPAPLTPPECDVRGMDWMPLYGHRLFGSEFWAKATDAGFRAAFKLWWTAFQQCPAASLPNDDAALCRLADMGRDIRGWKRIREEALHGFILCSDGRLYHRMLAGVALGAWDRRVRERQRKANWRGKRSGHDGDATGTTPGTGRGQDGQVPSDRIGQDRTVQKVREELVAGRTARPTGLDDLPPEADRPANGDRHVLPSSISAAVGQVTIALKGNARGQPFLTPPPAQRTVDAQIAAVVPPRRSKPIDRAALAKIRRQAGIPEPL